MKVDSLLVQKVSKKHHFLDVEKSFQTVTPIGVEPHHFLFFFRISQQIRSLKVLAKMDHRWQANSAGTKIFSVKFAHTCDKQMLKISKRHLDSYLS